jgi:hypothetical protein
LRCLCCSDGERQYLIVRYREDERGRRRLRPGHAFKGVSREPRISRYFFGRLGVGSALAMNQHVCRGRRVCPGGSELTLNRSQLLPRQRRQQPRVVEKSYEPKVPVKVGNPRAPVKGRPGYPPEGRGEQMDGVTQ